LAPGATNDELGQCLRAAIATFMAQAEICSKVLAMHSEQIATLSQALAMLGARLEQIEALLATLRANGNSADWWKGSGNN
jgi:type II secretory pathway component PulJ